MDNFNHILTQPFYNTIQLSPEQWKDKNDKALALETVIKIVFESNTKMKISVWQMWEFLSAKLQKKVNKVSVGRSFSNLKKQDLLIKLKEMRTGLEGESEHFYIWRKGNEHMGTEKLMPGKSIAEFATAMAPGKQGDIFS